MQWFVLNETLGPPTSFIQFYKYYDIVLLKYDSYPALYSYIYPALNLKDLDIELYTSRIDQCGVL